MKKKRDIKPANNGKSLLVSTIFLDWRFDLSDDVESRLQTVCFNPAKSVVLIYVTAVSEWVSEWVSQSMLSSLWEQQHTQREKEREKKFGNGRVLIGKAKSLEFQWPITRTKILTQQKSMIRWTIAQFGSK